MLRICIIFSIFLVSHVFLTDPGKGFNPTKCEVCQVVALEWGAKASRIHSRTETEFEDLFDNFCHNFNEYKVHKEKTGIERFARGPSKTIETLKEMRAKGVKVEIGLPYEMWDAPSAEITLLRQGCEILMENYEDIVEEWFISKTSVDYLTKLLCLENALKSDEKSCIVQKKENLEL